MATRAKAIEATGQLRVEYKSGELTNVSSGILPVRNGDVFITITTEEYYNNKDIYQASNKGKAPVVDKNGKRFLIDTTDIRYKNGEVLPIHKGEVLSKDADGNIKFVSCEEFNRSPDLVGVNKGKISGKNNPNSKNILVFDSSDNLMFRCEGNFKEVCRINGLPFITLSRSYRNGGSKIFVTKRGLIECYKRGNEKYIGWYACYEI